MIDPVLKKFGMFEARKSLKNFNPSSSFLSNNRTPTKTFTARNTKKQKTSQLSAHHQVQKFQQPTITTNNQQIPRLAFNEDPPVNKLQKIRAYLTSYYNKSCPYHNHHINKVKFICLNQLCTDSIGCAECFLYKHSDHQKVQIGACLKQLQDLENLIRNSNQIIISQKLVIKSQFMKQIDMQITHMCQQFNRSLQFLKNKALKQLDDNLFAKYQQLQALCSLRNNQNTNFSQSQLISQLLKIDIKGIQRDIDIQLSELSLEKINYQPIVKLFQQMNSALGHFTAQFKKCFPKVYRVKANIFNNSSFVNQSSQIKQQSKFHHLNAFRSDPQDYILNRKVQTRSFQYQ